MKRLLVLMAWLSVPGAIAFHLFSCGWFSPGRIPGNTRYPEMELRAERPSSATSTAAAALPWAGSK